MTNPPPKSGEWDHASPAPASPALRADVTEAGAPDRPRPEAEPTMIPGPAPADVEDAPQNEGAPPSSAGASRSSRLENSGASGLRQFDRTMNVPRVMLREPADGGKEPIVRPRSSEIPSEDGDSRYRIDGEIARGGMGVILKGRDTDLGRDLAIKVLLETHKDNPEVVQRFVEEAQIGGQLQHPGVAPVYELGRFSDRRPFFSMKLVKGETLSKLLADRADPTEDRARFIGIFEQVCQTMAYAHSRGVIHRDLKPANIMAGAFGEVQVMDWGLAKVLSAGGVADERKAHDKQQGQSVIQTLRSNVGGDAPVVGTVGSQTQMGSVMGTPAYMPPEQALGEIDSLDERADVFGLGAILCEILTGKPPYVGRDGSQVFRMASRGKLKDCFQRLDACGADPELIELTRHCLALEPADRPRHAGELADRVTQYLESVQTKLRATEVQRAAEAARAEQALLTAREHETAARAERRARRLQVGLAASFVCATTLGGLAAAWTAVVQTGLKNDAVLAERRADVARQAESKQRQLAVQEKTRAEAAMRTAEAEKLRSDNMLADMQTERGLQASQEGQPGAAAIWFANAALLTPHDPARQSANLLRTQTWLNEAWVPAAVLPTPEQDSRLFAFQPDGPLVFTISAGKLRVWDWRHEQPLSWSDPIAGVTDAVWSPTGRLLAVASDPGNVILYEPFSGQPAQRFRADNRVASLTWSPDGARLAVGTLSLQIWNVADAPRLETEWRHPAAVRALSFNRAGTRLVTACDDHQARVFSVGHPASPDPLFAVDHRPSVNMREAAPDFCDDDRKLVTIKLATKQPQLWDASTGQSIDAGWPSFDTHDRSLHVSRDGRWIAAAGGKSSLLACVDGRSYLLEQRNHLHEAEFSPDGSALMSVGYEGTAHVWKLIDLDRGPPPPPVFIPQQNTFAAGAFDAEGNALAISSNRHLVIWERAPTSWKAGTVDWRENVWRPRLSFDGQLVAPGAWHELYTNLRPRGTTLFVARVIDGAPAGPPVTLDGLLFDTCVNADNRTVSVATVADANARFDVYDIATGHPVFPSLALSALPHSVAARPGRPQAAVLCRNAVVHIIDTQKGVALRELAHAGDEGDMTTARVAYTPDGETLIVLTPAHVVYLHDAETGRLRFPPIRPLIEGGVCRSLAVSPDGRLLATAVTGVNMVQLWNLATGEKVGRELPHPGDTYGIWSVAFSPDGNWVVTGHKDGQVRIWDWKTGTLVGPPMRHPDEVYDAQFTSDGRHLLTCVRDNNLQIWDVATRRLAFPLQHEIVHAGGSTYSLAISEDRAIVSADGRYTVLDLAVLQPPPVDDLPYLLARAELANNQSLQLGELVPFEQHQWRERWQQYVAARQTPEAAVEALARAYSAAPSDSLRRTVVSRALRWNLADRLMQRLPDNPQLQMALARELLRAGRLAELKPRLPDVIARMRTALRQTPDDETLALGLSELLIAERAAPAWHPLEPSAISALSGCSFTPLPDGKILAGPSTQAPGDTYTLCAPSPVRRVAALKLETFPHPSLPMRGQGWGSGNFCLSELRAEVAHADGTTTPIKFRSAASDYLRTLDGDTAVGDGPWAAIDGGHRTRWDVHPPVSAPHWLVLDLEQPVELAENDALVVHLDFQHPVWFRFRLGCFRLAVSEEERIAESELLRAAVVSGSLKPFQALAAADLLRGDAAAVLERLEQDPKAGDADPDFAQKLLLASAHLHAGNQAAALGVLEPTLAYAALHPLPRHLHPLFMDVASRAGRRSLQELAQMFHPPEVELARLNQAIDDQPQSPARYNARAHYLTRLGRWRAAADEFARELKLSPDDRIAWQNVASCLLLAGDEPAYRELCRAMLEKFRGTTLPRIASGTCKVCLLLPDAVDQSELPLALLRASADDVNYRLWAYPNLALAALRAGDHQAALDLANQQPNLIGHAGTQMLLVRAMAEECLGRHDEAVISLARAESTIPEELQSLGTPEFTGSLPVESAIVHRDSLVNEILRREALRLIHKTDARRSPADKLRADGERRMRQGDWTEAARLTLEHLDISPHDRILYSKAAPLHLLADDVEAYRRLCRRMLEEFAAAPTDEQTDSLCKVCMLLPEPVDREKLPLDVLQRALDNPTTPATVLQWFRACRALVAYRDGDFPRAADGCEKALEIGRNSSCLAMIHAVHAMAHHQLNDPDRARKSLDEATKLIPYPLATLGKPEFVGLLPVGADVVNHDWLIAELLRREASLLIHKTAARSPPAP